MSTQGKNPNDVSLSDLIAEMQDDIVTLREKMFTGELRAEDVSPIAKVPWAARVLREALFHRCVELVEAGLHDVQARRSVAATLCGRALLETCGLLHWLRQRTERFATGVGHKEEPQAFMDFVYQAIAGRGRKGTGPLTPAAIDVKKLIGKLDVTIRSPDGRGGAVKKLYSNLSEVAHPNMLGVVATYVQHPDGDISNATVGNIVGSDGELMKSVMSPLRVGVGLAHDDYTRLENLDAALREACEKAWPMPD